MIDTDFGKVESKPAAVPDSAQPAPMEPNTTIPPPETETRSSKWLWIGIIAVALIVVVLWLLKII